MIIIIILVPGFKHPFHIFKAEQALNRTFYNNIE